MSDYTPSVDAWRDWLHNNIEPEAVESFDRMIAQVRAEALREAREALIADQIDGYGIVLPDVSDAVDLLNERADRIEREAGI